MYIEAVPNRNSPPAILLRESYRHEGKVRKRTLCNLSDWSAAHVEGLRGVLKGGTVIPAEHDAITVTRSLPHGHVAAALGTARKIGLDRILGMNGLFVVSIDVILSPSCFAKHDHLTRPLRSGPITRPSLLLQGDPPQFLASVLSPRGLAACASPFTSRKLVPAVPRKSLCPTRAPYTPAAVRSLIRLAAVLSQEKKAPLILTTFDTLTTRHRWVSR
jgi:hypothetical protein